MGFECAWVRSSIRWAIEVGNSSKETGKQDVKMLGSNLGHTCRDWEARKEIDHVMVAWLSLAA